MRGVPKQDARRIPMCGMREAPRNWILLDDPTSPSEGHPEAGRPFVDPGLQSEGRPESGRPFEDPGVRSE
eukprot:4835607-Alexandrium_andersonii.AAC.1